MNRTTRLLAIVLLPALSLGIGAQVTLCPLPPIDDGFAAGPCCSPAMQSIPQFPVVQTTGVYGCIADCQLDRDFQTRVRFDWQPLLCDYATIAVTVTPASPGAPAMGGTLFAKYARTFLEVNAAGQQVQVWRYLVNGDLRYSTTGGTSVPCPMPITATNMRPIHFFGSIDYRCDPTGVAGFQVRYDLTHLPQCISNAPFSTRPFAITPGIPSFSYHLVGPAPFSFTPAPAPSGIVPAESARSSRVNWIPFAYQCLHEQRLQGNITTLAQNCLCSPVTPVTPLRYSEQAFTGTTSCAGVSSTFSSLGIPGLTSGVLALNLGSYANGPRLTVYWGVFLYTDLCTQEGPIHVFAGSGTTRNAGYQLFSSVTPVLTRTVLDLGNSLVLDTFPPTLGWGSPYVSTTVLNLAL